MQCNFILVVDKLLLDSVAFELQKTFIVKESINEQLFFAHPAGVTFSYLFGFFDGPGGTGSAVGHKLVNSPRVLSELFHRQGLVTFSTLLNHINPSV